MKNGIAKMVQYKDYVAGWLDSSIRDFLEGLDGVPADMVYALITCLDSNLNPASLVRKSPAFRSLSLSIVAVGEAILIPTIDLMEVNARSQIFFGFDEVWFLPGVVLDPKPDSAWLVGPSRLSPQKLRKLGPWMTKCDCSLGLGGGEGLNVVVKAGGLAKHLIAHSLLQPQHIMTA